MRPVRVPSEHLAARVASVEMRRAIWRGWHKGDAASRLHAPELADVAQELETPR